MRMFKSEMHLDCHG